VRNKAGEVKTRLAVGLLLAVTFASWLAPGPALAGPFREHSSVLAGTSSNSLDAISCPSITFCMAVGTSTDTSGDFPLSEKWNGTTWSRGGMPDPSSSTYALVFGVSCTSSTSCTAAGSYRNPGKTGNLLAFAEHWNGRTWAISVLGAPKAPAGSVTNAEAVSVSCTSATRCRAVGDDANQTYGTDVVEVWSWNGSSWTWVTVPKPSGSTAYALDSISCTSTSYCVATGLRETVVGGYYVVVTLAESWNGSSWTLRPSSSPKSALPPANLDVSCRASRICFAGGAYSNTSGSEYTLSERWSGTSWSTLPTKNVPGDQLNSFAAISCTATTCIAAGNSQDTNTGNTVTLAEYWNGSSWSVMHTTNVPGGNDNQFNGVSCASTNACTAVGEDNAGAGLSTLIERWNGKTWALQHAP
jgi:hypothetical protein